MRPSMRWLGEGRLQINAYDYPPQDLADGSLLFIPITGAHGWVGWRRPHLYSVVYPCAGLLAEGQPTAPNALRRLIGPARATLLNHLDNPMSTTQLVSATGFALGAVGNHLKVLPGRTTGTPPPRRPIRPLLPHTRRRPADMRHPPTTIKTPAHQPNSRHVLLTTALRTTPGAKIL